MLISTRRAADLLQPTPMDRPEDVEANPVSGRVCVMLTNNASRTAQQVNAINPRASNAHGHVIEMIPPGAGTRPIMPRPRLVGIFLLAGEPGVDAGARYHRAATENGWLSCPDNCAFDGAASGSRPTARHAAGWPTASGRDTTGDGRALPGFYRAPTGAEVCGPELHARRPHAVPGHPAPRRRPRLHLRAAVDPLAGLRRHAAAALGGRYRQAGRRRDRVIKGARPAAGVIDRPEAERSRGPQVDDGGRVDLEQPARPHQAAHEDEGADGRRLGVDVAVADLAEGRERGRVD